MKQSLLYIVKAVGELGVEHRSCTRSVAEKHDITLEEAKKVLDNLKEPLSLIKLTNSEKGILIVLWNNGNMYPYPVTACFCNTVTVTPEIINVDK